MLSYRYDNFTARIAPLRLLRIQLPYQGEPSPNPREVRPEGCPTIEKDCRPNGRQSEETILENISPWTPSRSEASRCPTAPQGRLLGRRGTGGVRRAHTINASKTGTRRAALRRRRLHIPRFPCLHGKLVRSAAPPFPTGPAALGSCGGPLLSGFDWQRSTARRLSNDRKRLPSRWTAV